MASSKRELLTRILTFVTFFVVIFLLASLVTHSDADPPRGDNERLHNLCGRWGAWVSHHLLAVLGSGSYIVLLLVLALAGAYAARSSMPRRYAVSTSLLALALFVILSLTSFDAGADSHRFWSSDGAARNACGLAGRTVAYYLMVYIGAGVWVLLLGLLVALAAYIARKEVPDKLLRATGVALLASFVSALLNVMHNHHGLWKPAVSEVLPIGLGGTLGDFVGTLFVAQLGLVGAYLVLALVAVVGLLLSTDTLILLFPLVVWRWLRRRKIGRIEAVQQAGERLRRGYAAAREAMAAGAVTGAAAVAAARSGDDENDAADDKTGSKKKRKRRAAGRDAAEDQQEIEDQEADAKPPARPSPRIRVAQERKVSQPAETSATEGDEEADPRRMRLADAAEGPGDQMPAYAFPSLDLLMPPEAFDISAEEDAIRQNAENLEATLRQFGVEAEVVGIDTGPVITQYEVSLGAGVKVGKVISLSDDLAIGLKAQSVRIVAPLPGRGTIGIEVPNRKRKVVRLREVIEDGLPSTKRFNLPLFLGKDTAGNPLVRDLTAMPHLLIGGTTGSGKSICLNSIICSIIFTRSPRDVKFILVDPKMVEMSIFSRIPHLMCPVVSDMSKVYSILEWLMGKMEERYGLLAEAGVKNIVGYNALTREQIIERFKPTSPEDELRLTYHMPYIILIVDELADLMMTAPKEVEAAITRLAQKSRAVGIHLVLATQRPSVDVVTGLIKSNHPCRIAFQVASRVDSRTIIDCMGAEKLLGQGDMLLMQPGASKLLRGQGAFVREDEINKVVDYISIAPREYNRELVQLKPKSPVQARGRGGVKLADDASYEERDDLYVDAVRIVLQHQRGSVSLLQRKLNIGYGRASRLIDFMAEAGLVGEYQGSQAREALIGLDEWEAQRGEGVGALSVAGGGDDDDEADLDDPED